MTIEKIRLIVSRKCWPL